MKFGAHLGGGGRRHLAAVSAAARGAVVGDTGLDGFLRVNLGQHYT